MARDPVRDAVDAVYRAESRRVFATLVRLLDDQDRSLWNRAQISEGAARKGR